MPGHQIVGVVAAAAPGVDLKVGARVGISWLGGTDGTCRFCLEGRENLCDHPVYTGYDVDGGYAKAVVARADFAYPLSDRLDDLHAAPLLCAGIIGFRALRVAGVQKGERVGALRLRVVRASRAADSQELGMLRIRRHARREASRDRGETWSDWVGKEHHRPPEPLDRAVTFAPVGSVVVSALGALRKGGVVAINAIHLNHIPQFDYDSLLWGEREIRSVTNMTRADARDFSNSRRSSNSSPRRTSSRSNGSTTHSGP